MLETEMIPRTPFDNTAITITARNGKSFNSKRNEVPLLRYNLNMLSNGFIKNFYRHSVNKMTTELNNLNAESVLLSELMILANYHFQPLMG